MPPISLWQENDNSLCLINKPAIANFISLWILSSLGIEKNHIHLYLLYWCDINSVISLSCHFSTCESNARDFLWTEGQYGPHSVLWTSLNFKLRLYFSIYVPMQCTHAYRCAHTPKINYTPTHGVSGMSAPNIHDEVTRMARHLCRTGVLLYPFRILLACVLTWASS